MIPASVSIDFEVDELYTSVAANVGGLQVPNAIGCGFCTLKKCTAWQIWSAHESDKRPFTGLPRRPARSCFGCR